MRPLNPTELPQLNSLGKGHFTLIYLQVASLQPGTGLVIERSDFKTKGTPYRIFKNVMKNTGITLLYGRMPDGSGWFVKRNG